MRKLLLPMIGSALLASAACSVDLGDSPPTSGPRAAFDPATGTIPLPTNLLLNPETRQLNVPIADEDTPLTKDIKANLNRLDGWPLANTIMIPVDAPLDLATVNGDTVLLFDLGTEDSPAVTRVPTGSYQVLYNVGSEPRTEPPYTITVVNRVTNTAGEPIGGLPPEFSHSHTYAVVVTDAVRGADGNPLLGHPALELLKSSTPLADASGKSLTILPNSDAVQLEAVRSAHFGPAFNALEASGNVQRDKVPAYTVFSVQSNPIGVFNPSAIGRRMPTPMTATAALDVEIRAELDLAYQASTVQGGTKLFKMTDSALTPVTFTVEQPAPADGFFPIVLRPTALEAATTYMVVLTEAIMGENGSPARPSSFFALMKSEHPLVDASTDPPTLGSPFLDLRLDLLLLQNKDPQTATADDWAGAFNLLKPNLTSLETMRQSYQPLFEKAEGANLTREEQVIMWTFTTAAAQ